MVWCDIWVPLTSLKCAWSWVAFIIRFRRAPFTMKRPSVWDVAKGRPLLCLSVTLPVSLLQPADDTLWHSKLSGHIRLRTSCLKPRNGEVLLISCGVVLVSWCQNVNSILKPTGVHKVGLLPSNCHSSQDMYDQVPRFKKLAWCSCLRDCLNSNAHRTK